MNWHGPPMHHHGGSLFSMSQHGGIFLIIQNKNFHAFYFVFHYNNFLFVYPSHEMMMVSMAHVHVIT